MRAAIATRRAVASVAAGGPAPLEREVGVYRGPAIAVTLDDRVDYFGQTVNIAARIQGLAGADAICVTASSLRPDELADALGGAELPREDVDLEGVAGRVAIVRLPGEPPRRQAAG